MALPRQSRKHSVFLQPRKLRLRLVQLAATLVPSSSVEVGTRTLQLTFLPPGIGPQQLWVIGGATPEMVQVESVNPATNEVTLTNQTRKSHVPGAEGVPFVPSGVSYRQVWGPQGPWMWASWAGLNGKNAQGHGWEEGDYLRQMIEEGQGKFVLPNAPGSDGMLHRDRFLILSDQNYRVGDEWLELWASPYTEGTAGDLLFVGTPYAAELTETQVTLQLYDAMWCLKKQRESNAGFWNNAPRDVFEEYTKQMQVFCADGFDSPANLPQAASLVGESADQRWKVSNGIVSPVPSNVRLLPFGSGTQSYLRFNTPLSIGTSLFTEKTEANLRNWQKRFRFECSFTVPSGQAPNMAMELVPAEWPGGTGGTLFLLLSPTEGALHSYLGGGVAARQTIQKTSANSAFFGSGAHTVVIEGRGRWVFFYCDGVLLGTLPTTEPAQNLYPQITFFDTSGGASVGAGYGTYMDIDYAIVRQAVPFLMNSAKDKGDYALPGVPTGNGLKGEYFNDSDLANDGAQGGKVLAPLRQPYATRVDSIINFPLKSEWWVAGPPEGHNFTVRWTGSIYLDISNFDYTLKLEGPHGIRMWLGKTRWMEQVIDAWQGGKGSGYVTFAAGSVEAKGNAEAPGPLYGLASGWYPIIIEYQFGAPGSPEAEPQLKFLYERSDGEVTVPVNVSPYAHVVAGDEPYGYWQLNDGGASFKASYTNGGNLALLPAFAEATTTPKGVAAPVPNDRAPEYVAAVTTAFPKTPAAFNTVGWPGFSVEAWIKPAVVTGETVIFDKQANLFMAVNNGLLRCATGDGTSYLLIAEGGTIPAGVWTHVAFTYDGKTLRTYVNGVLAVTTAENATCFSGAEVTALGWAPVPKAGYFSGAISHLAVYNKALSAARLLAHVQSITSPALLNNGQVVAVSNVPLTPQGVFAQQVRSEAHFELLKGFAEEWGLQWTVRPRSLESGEFPGLMCPRLAEGRATDYVIDSSNIVAPTVKYLADDTADTLLLEAQGLADPTNSGQLQAEVINFFAVAAHALVNTEFDSPGDIQVREQLVRRGQSLLALRSAPWSEISSKARGKRTLTDTWPLTGALAEFAWLPGDGVRMEMPALGIEDQSTRQMYGIQWPVFPDGIGAPTPNFKARPRSVKEAIRHVITAIRNKSHNYQGQFAIQDGCQGSINYNNGTITAGPAADAFTRLTLPTNLAKVRALMLSVQTLVISNMVWTLVINGVSTGIVVTETGSINVLPFLERNATRPRIYAKLEGSGVGSGSYEIKLEAQIII